MRKMPIIFLLFFISSCSQIVQFDYRVDLSRNELKVLKSYMRNYYDLHNIIFVKGKFVYSNDEELLHKLKKRVSGVACDLNKVMIPVIINNNGHYYFVNNLEKLREINWFNDYEIYMNFSENDLEVIELNIPAEMMNLSKTEFISKYLIEKNNYYTAKIGPELFNDEKNELFFYTILLSQIKYDFMVKYQEYSPSIQIIDINIKKIIINKPDQTSHNRCIYATPPVRRLGALFA
jgi:hypothetical protein